MRRGILAVLACLLLAACVISEQDGQLVPQGNPRFTDQSLGEVTFHFDSSFNKAVVFGRGLLLILLGVWLIRLRSVVPIVLGVAAVVAALWLTGRDLPVLFHYRIAALESGLELTIPPAPTRALGWDEISELRIAGFVASRGAGKAATSPFSPDIRDWRDLDLVLEGGESLHVDLEPLSIEQRESVWRAIVARAGLVGG